MTTINKYKIYCTTESQYRYIWDTVAPTTCPFNNAHTVNTDSVNKITSVCKFYNTNITPLNTDGHNFYRLETSGNAMTINLPAISTSIGRVIIIQRLTDNINQLNIVPFGADKINNIASNYLLTGNKSNTASTTAFVKLQATAPDNWVILNIDTSTKEDENQLEPSIIKDTDEPPNSTHYMGWNSVMKQWESRSIPINDLSDVTITAPATNQVLQYNGSNWINANVTGNTIDTYSNIFAASSTNGYIGVTTDLRGVFIYNGGWESIKSRLPILSPSTYTYASLTTSTSLDHANNRYWYRWRARDFTVQTYTANTIPSTATIGTNYQSSANQGGAVAYNDTNQAIVTGGTPSTIYLDINASTTGSVTFQFGNPLGQQNYSATGGINYYSGWTIFMVVKDLVRIGNSGRFFTIDSQLAPVHSGPAYSPADWQRTDAIVVNFQNTSTNLDLTTNYGNTTVGSSSITTGKTCIVALRFNQITRMFTMHLNTVENVYETSIPSITNPTPYYENTSTDILQYLRLGNNHTNATENSRFKLYELIVINHAVEDMRQVMVALHNEYTSS